jgi:hypothetical protein
MLVVSITPGQKEEGGATWMSSVNTKPVAPVSIWNIYQAYTKSLKHPGSLGGHPHLKPPSHSRGACVSGLLLLLRTQPGSPFCSSCCSRHPLSLSLSLSLSPSLACSLTLSLCSSHSFFSSLYLLPFFVTVSPGHVQSTGHCLISLSLSSSFFQMPLSLCVSVSVSVSVSLSL